MMIAARTLNLSQPGGDIEIPIRIFAPEQEANSWSCRFEIDWPDGTLKRAAGGIDAVQALELAMKMIGALIYTSEHRDGRSDVAGAKKGLRLPGGE